MTHAVSPEENHPARPEEIVVFLVDDKPVNVGDVIDAAAFGGGLRASWLDLLRKLHREDIAVDADMEADDEKVQALADQFRYDHDLISAEETEAWFEKRALTMEDFHDCITRQFWDEELAEREAPEPIDLSAASPEQRDLLRAEVLISGQFERFATALSWRMAASRGSSGALNDNGDAEGLERNRFIERTGIETAAIEKWLETLGRDNAWFREMLKMEAAYRENRAHALTPEKRSRMVSSLRLPLTLLEVETVEFDRADAANEAYLCVHEDGLSMEELAQMGRYPYTKRELLVEDLSEDWQRRFLAAAEGATLEPVSDDGAFHLCRLLRKQEPKIEDSSVSRRVDQRVLESHFAELSAQCVRWVLR